MQTLGKYQLIAEIARGGMGIVYLAVASGPAGFSKLFVIKELKPELVEDATFFDMFLEEARLAARLSHPNIVTTYEVGADGKRPFIVMDYLDGESLGRILRKKSPSFTPMMHLRILCHVLDGLEYAHDLRNFDDSAASVVHRDMSPQNVFVTFDGQVKIVDFGIAKSADTSIETQAGIFKGKPGYMAPEQLSGDVDPRADVFSVGVMLWEAIADRRMWPQKNQVEILTALIKGNFPRLGDVKPDAPEDLKRICDKATQKDPDLRYQSARELRLDIEAFLESRGERMTVREISKVVGAMFEDQRKKLRAVMEKCIAEAKEGKVAAKLPSLAPPPLETTTPKPMENDHVSSRLAALSGPPESNRVISVVSGLSGTPVSQATPDGAALSLVQDAERAKGSKRRNAILLLVALLLVAGSVVATIFVVNGSRGDTRGPSSAAAVAPTSTPSAPIAATAGAAPTVAPTPAAPDPAAVESAKALASAQAAAASAAAVAAQPKTRVVYVPVPAPAPRPVTPPPAVAPSPAAAPAEKPAATNKNDCNPPFYFEGTKKVFKPGCL